MEHAGKAADGEGAPGIVIKEISLLRIVSVPMHPAHTDKEITFIGL